jgi:hypothetical protein
MAGIVVGITADTDTIGNRGVRCGAEMQFWLKTASKLFLPGIKTARSWSEICNRGVLRGMWLRHLHESVSAKGSEKKLDGMSNRLLC